MSKCSVPGCTTNENTRINGKCLTLFSFPCYDDSLIKQWEEKSKVIKAPDQNPTELRLCQLHFESDSFPSEEKNVLAPGAVPTIFELNNKRKIKDEKNKSDEPGEPREPPLKQRKSEENEEPPTVTNTPRSSPVKTKSEASIDKSEQQVGNSATNVIRKAENNLNRSIGGTSVFMKQIDMGKKVYRLIIRIDKVINKKDLSNNNSKVFETEQAGNKIAKLTSLDVKNVGVVKPCLKTGCKLIKTVMNSKPLFQCEICNKFYIIKENNIPIKREESNFKCYKCNEILPSQDTLSVHLRKHFICDMCHAQCSTQISYDKHLRLHVSTDSLLPYKCHKCPSLFEVKAEVCAHYAEKHTKIVQERAKNDKDKLKTGKVLFRCEYCYAVFQKEESYKSHVELHMGNGEFNCVLCSKRFKTAEHLAMHQARHLGGLKYTCSICENEFSSFETVQSHMKSHMDIKSEEYKCNFCNKIFENESTLNSHVRVHLSNAHKCQKCQKSFINNATLRIHLKTHSEEPSNSSPSKDLVVIKRHTCSLCSSTFDSRSKLYNHIMTHLEQMHAGVETVGNIVIDGLDELLESDEDILS